MEDCTDPLPPDIIISCRHGNDAARQETVPESMSTGQGTNPTSSASKFSGGKRLGKDGEVGSGTSEPKQDVLKEQKTSQEVKEALQCILLSVKGEKGTQGVNTLVDDWSQILDHMKQYPNDGELQQLACTVCSCLIQHSWMILQPELFNHVLDMLGKHRNDRALQVQLSMLHLLASFLEDAQWQEQLLMSSERRVLVEVMKQCEASPAILMQGLDLLSMLSSSKQGQNSLLGDEVHMFAMELLQRHSHHDEVVRSCLHLLATLLAGTEEDKPSLSCQALVTGDLPAILLDCVADSRLSVDTVILAVQLYATLVSCCCEIGQQALLHMYNWLTQMHGTMGVHVDNPQLQISCSKLLTMLLDQCPHLAEYIGEGTAQVSLHTSCLGAVLVHSEDASVVHSVFTALHTMAEKSSAIQTALLEKNSHVAVFVAMKSHHMEHASVLETGCQLLRTLALNGNEGKQALLQEEILGVAKHCLARFPEKLSVVTAAFLLLGCLGEHDGAREWCHAHGMEQPVLSFLWWHQQVIDFQLVVLETMAVLSGSDDFAGKLNDLGALHDIVDIMKSWEAEQGIQQVGLCLIQLLGDQVNRYEKKLGQDAVKVVQSVMQRFGSSVAIQSESCVALQLLCDQEIYISQLLVTNSIQGLLFNILNIEPKSPAMRRTQSSASQLIHTLACVANLKDMMLLLACTHGQTMEAECLLELGADVNYGSGLDTPLCHACKARNHSLVQKLLDRGVSELQTAVMLCLDMKSHSLVGMILKHIGIDHANGSISWSGLGLADLQPEWLKPTFVMDSGVQPRVAKDPGKSLAQRILSAHQKLEEAREEQSRRELVSSYTVVMATSSAEGHMSVQVEGELEETFPTPGPDQGVTMDSTVAPWRSRTMVGSTLPCHPRDARLLLPTVPLEQTGHQQPDPDPAEQAGWSTDGHRRSNSDTCQSPATSYSPVQHPTTDHHESGSWDLDSLPTPGGATYDQSPSIQLDLSSNEMVDMSGVMGAENSDLLTSLRCLTKLDLSNNQLLNIPEELFQYLSQLEHLDFSNNELHCFPVSISQCQRLMVMNGSRNKLVDFNLGGERPLVFLQELDISHNWLQLFPVWVATSMPNLHTLNMAGNAVECLPEVTFELPLLTTLNLSSNDLDTLPEQFLMNCIKLETLYLSGNSITEAGLPDSEELTSRLERLTTVDLAHNQLARQSPFYLPKFVLQLPSLKWLNLENNQLMGVARPDMWTTGSLRTLLLAHNSITELNLEKAEEKHWSSSLEKLDLSHNKLQKLPREIGKLSWLTSLDVSHNPGLTSLPDEMGRLERLWELKLEGLKLDLDPGLLKQRTKDIVGYLHQKLKKSVQYYHMKLMVVGFGCRGKTCLLRALQKQRNPQHSLPTVGVVIKPWKFRERRGTKFVTYSLSTWDFAGQEEFHSTHQCFLSNRAVYLVVYNLQYGVREIDVLKPWLLNIKARAPHCPVIVVGTHRDLVPSGELDSLISEMRSKITDLCDKPGYPEIRGMAEVCCTRETSWMERLRVLLKQVLDNFKVMNQPMMGQKVPASYVELQEALAEEAHKLKQAEQAPIVNQQRLRDIVQNCDLNLQGEDLKQAIRFLHDGGNLLHYDDVRLKMDQLYFLDPEWLCRMMSQVITVPQINPFIHNGILQREALVQLFSGKKVGDEKAFHVFPPVLIPQYISLLEKFEIALPTSEDEMLIACRLPAARPKLRLPFGNHSHVLIRRHYEMQYTPSGFWSRLLTRVLAFLPQLTAEVDPDLDDQPVTKYWREGIYGGYNEQAFFLVESSYRETESVDITVPPSRVGARFLGQLVDHIDSLIEEWFPGLLEETVTGEKLLHRLVPCVKCRGEDAHRFKLEELISAAESSDEIECPRHEEMVLLASLAPDVVLADLQPVYRLQRNKLEFSDSTDTLLGDGGFGKVYKGRYRRQSVAVKVFTGAVNVHPHKLMRTEVVILEKLRHPSLVSLVGVALQPRAAVLELAPLGALGTLLKSDRTFCRPLQHRMALQVADGLRYLHQRQIVYRDLKPANILVFSLSLTMMINVKISDYGTSRLAGPHGLVSTEGTVGYRAPEVIRGQPYSCEADVYSLGMTLYELVTGGKRPFSMTEHPSELEEAILRGDPLQPISCGGHDPWPDMEDLIGQCVEHASDHRPSCESVYQQLCLVDLLSLHRLVPISKDNTVEVATCLSTETGQIEVMMASNSCESVHLSWLTLGSSSHGELRGAFLKDSYILCMLPVGSGHVIMGSQSGKVWVCDTKSHNISRLPCVIVSDSVLSLFHFVSSEVDCILVGMANGQIVMYDTEQILRGDGLVTPPQVLCVGSPLEPIKCLCLGSVSRGRVIAGVGCGIQAVKLWPRLKKDSVVSWDTHTKGGERGVVSTILKDRRFIHLAKQGSPVLERWHLFSQSLKTTFSVLHYMDRLQVPVAVALDSRITSLSQTAASNQLWMGTGTGHIIVVESETYQPLTQICRHMSSVRCLVPISIPGDHCSQTYIVSAGKGFKSQCHKDPDCSYLAVWNSDLAGQERQLQEHLHRRRGWTWQQPTFAT